VLKVIFVEPALSEVERLDELPTKVSTIKLELLQRVSLSMLAALVLFLGIAPAPLVSRIIASLP